MVFLLLLDGRWLWKTCTTSPMSVIACGKFKLSHLNLRSFATVRGPAMSKRALSPGPEVLGVGKRSKSRTQSDTRAFCPR
jgi:hypothetical protein